MVLNQHLLCAVIYQHFIMPAPPRFIDYSKLKESSGFNTRWTAYVAYWLPHRTQFY